MIDILIIAATVIVLLVWMRCHDAQVRHDLSDSTTADSLLAAQVVMAAQAKVIAKRDDSIRVINSMLAKSDSVARKFQLEHQGKAKTLIKVIREKAPPEVRVLVDSLQKELASERAGYEEQLAAKDSIVRNLTTQVSIHSEQEKKLEDLNKSLAVQVAHRNRPSLIDRLTGNAQVVGITMGVTYAAVKLLKL